MEQSQEGARTNFHLTPEKERPWKMRRGRREDGWTERRAGAAKSGYASQLL